VTEKLMTYAIGRGIEPSDKACRAEDRPGRGCQRLPVWSSIILGINLE
jgi:hypothetical protein